MFEEILTLAIPVLVAALAGGLIGLERESRSKSAGFRTMILIAMGSCLFTLMSIELGAGDKESSRIAASIVAGIGFLGAGVIIRDGLKIRGLTTATSVWLAASLGMAAAIGAYELVGVVTVLALVVLMALPPIERLLERLTEFTNISITIKNTDKAEDNVLDIFDECNIKILKIRRSILTKGERVLHINAKMRPSKHSELSEILVNEKGLIKIEY